MLEFSRDKRKKIPKNVLTPQFATRVYRGWYERGAYDVRAIRQGLFSVSINCTKLTHYETVGRGWHLSDRTNAPRFRANAFLQQTENRLKGAEDSRPTRRPFENKRPLPYGRRQDRGNGVFSVVPKDKRPFVWNLNTHRFRTTVEPVSVNK